MMHLPKTIFICTSREFHECLHDRHAAAWLNWVSTTTQSKDKEIKRKQTIGVKVGMMDADRLETFLQLTLPRFHPLHYEKGSPTALDSIQQINAESRWVDGCMDGQTLFNCYKLQNRYLPFVLHPTDKRDYFCFHWMSFLCHFNLKMSYLPIAETTDAIISFSGSQSRIKTNIICHTNKMTLGFLYRF